MPSFDISSEVNMANLTNSIDVASRMIINRYDFKGTTAKVEFSEKELTITLYGDSDFQLGQIKDILLPAMEKKEADSAKRLEPQSIQTVSGNNLKVQAAIQGESVRVSGAKRDNLQDAIAFVKKSITDFPLQFGNFRD